MLSTSFWKSVSKEVSVTRLPRRGRLFGAGFGALAGLVNPAFLILTFSDTDTGLINRCESAVESIDKAHEDDMQ